MIMKLLLGIVTALCMLSGMPASARPLEDAANWPYLPQCHQCVTPVIFQREGIDTANAKILARVDEATAADFCANFAPGDDEATCAAQVLVEQAGRIYTAQADCPAGKLIDSFGAAFRVAGIWNEGLASGRVRLTDAEGETVQVGLHVAGLPLSTQWAVLCPTITPISDEFPRRDGAFGNVVGIDHNGSFMWVSQDLSVIYYEDPKDALAGTVSKGQVLYRGDPIPTKPGSQVSGTAYTFRKGCEPAPYPVTGSASPDGQQLILRGKAPKRAESGCAVVGYTSTSSNAVLVFDYHYGDI